jgi:hypothetical protein
MPASALPGNILESLDRRRHPKAWPLLKAARFRRYKCNRIDIITDRDAQGAVSLDNCAPPCYLAGYWQSERYFLSHAQTIRKDFSLRAALSQRCETIAREIKNRAAVSLHVRRGDYVANPATAAFHGVCGMDYYKDAVAHIKARLPDAHFHVFSDDPDWAEQNMSAAASPMTVLRGNTAHEDMHLMSLCSHNIIANSSFGWWGGWLNENPEKVVCAPKRWLAQAPENFCDPCPESWVRL